VRPYFRSPTRAMLSFSRRLSFLMVYRSRRVWVGWWPAPSPALITGTGENWEARRAEPSLGWRMTRASEYPATTRTVSARDSPLDMEEPSAGPRLITLPPSLFIAVSKDMRVLVEGSKKSRARILPAIMSLFLPRA